MVVGVAEESMGALVVARVVALGVARVVVAAVGVAVVGVALLYLTSADNRRSI